MMQKFGESFAKQIGDAHEKGCAGTAYDYCVDALNNKAALDSARDNPGIDPATVANNMWSTGRLYCYGKKNRWLLSRLKMNCNIFCCDFCNS